MIRKSTLFTFIAWALVIWLGQTELSAQNKADSLITMTLDECVDYAMEHNKTLQNARFDQYIAQKDVEEIIARGLPQLDVSADLIYNFELPVFVLPDPNNEGQFNEITFGLPWQASAGASLSQLIFDGRYFLGLRASRVFVELSEKQKSQSVEQTALNIHQAYYTALISEEQLSLLTANVERLQKLYDETAALNREGFVEKIDVDRLQISLTNLNTQLQNARRLAGLTKELLKFQMGMPVHQDIQLVSLAESINPQLPNATILTDFNPENKIEYQILATSRELETFNARQYKVGYLPAIYGFASYTLNRQWENPTSINFRTGALGFQLSWSLFDGGQRIKKLQKSKIALRKIDNQMLDFQNGARLELEQAFTSLTNAYNSWESQKENKTLAEKVYRVSSIKYKEGVGSSIEVNEAETQLKEAESNYLNSLYDYLMAKVELEKANGEFSKYQE